MEGRHHRAPRLPYCCEAERGREGLVHVHDVEPAPEEQPLETAEHVDGKADARDRSVQPEGEAPSQREHGDRVLLRERS